LESAARAQSPEQTGKSIRRRRTPIDRLPEDRERPRPERSSGRYFSCWAPFVLLLFRRTRGATRLPSISALASGAPFSPPQTVDRQKVARNLRDGLAGRSAAASVAVPAPGARFE
jgi:hypothetical protein